MLKFKNFDFFQIKFFINHQFNSKFEKNFICATCFFFEIATLFKTFSIFSCKSFIHRIMTFRLRDINSLNVFNWNEKNVNELTNIFHSFSITQALSHNRFVFSKIIEKKVSFNYVDHSNEIDVKNFYENNDHDMKKNLFFWNNLKLTVIDTSQTKKI